MPLTAVINFSTGTNGIAIIARWNN